MAPAAETVVCDDQLLYTSLLCPSTHSLEQNPFLEKSETELTHPGRRQTSPGLPGGGGGWPSLDEEEPVAVVEDEDVGGPPGCGGPRGGDPCGWW